MLSILDEKWQNVDFGREVTTCGATHLSSNGGLVFICSFKMPLILGMILLLDVMIVALPYIEARTDYLSSLLLCDLSFDLCERGLPLQFVFQDNEGWFTF